MPTNEQSEPATATATPREPKRKHRRKRPAPGTDPATAVTCPLAGTGLNEEPEGPPLATDRSRRAQRDAATEGSIVSVLLTCTFPQTGLSIHEITAQVGMPFVEVATALSVLVHQGYVDLIPPAKAGRHFRPNILTATLEARPPWGTLEGRPRWEAMDQPDQDGAAPPPEAPPQI